MPRLEAFDFTTMKGDKPGSRPGDVMGQLLSGCSAGPDPRSAAVLRLVERSVPDQRRIKAGMMSPERTPATPRKARSVKSERVGCYMTRETADRLEKAKAAIRERVPASAAHKISKSGILGLCLDMLLKDHDRRGPDSVLSRACSARAVRREE